MVSTATEQKLIDLILVPITNDTIAVGQARKEREIGSFLATLSAIESWALHKRLSTGVADDPLVAVFQRLVPERRRRLLGFVADARRRAAISRKAA